MAVSLLVTVGILFLTVYLPSCLILIAFPQLLHKKKNLGYPVQLIAHRGGAGERLENTMAAFRWAVEQNHVDMLELDVHLTKDKKIVVVHDSNLKRITGLDASVEDLEYSELPLLNQNLLVTFADSRCERLCDDRKIALLSEVLDAFPNTPINIDLKKASPELIEMTANMIHQYKRENITLWGSVSSRVLEQCHQHDPSIPLYVSKERVFLYPLLFWTGILAFIPIREAAYEVPLPSIYLGRQFNRGWLFRTLGPLVACLSELLILNSPFVSYLQRRGIPTIVWVLNCSEDYSRAYRLGAAGVHTDFPSKLRHYLDSHEDMTSSKKKR